MRTRRVLRWLGVTLLGLAGLAMAFALAIYVAMQQDLGKSFAIEGHAVAVPTDAASIEEGQRQAQLRGCSGGCHGRTAEGQVFFELFDGTRVIAPDLARIAARYSNTELERAIRHGVKPDGTSVLRVMPSEMFARLSDRHLGMIIAYLRSEAEREEPLPEPRYGPVARIIGMMFKRDFGTVLAAEVIDHAHPTPVGPVEEARLGRYLALTVCTECHGDDLRGTPDGSTPSLAMTLAYSREDFERLLREGKPLGERELGLMAGVARSRFVRFTDEELTALHAYLHDPSTWSD